VTNRRYPGRRRISRLVHALVSAMPLMLALSPAQAHDPSAWGGLFRSRDGGATWMSANQGMFLSGAIAVAVSPIDANDVLLGTESGLFRSRNAGRDWRTEAPLVVRGSVLAAAFSADGRQALISTGLGIFRSAGDGEWQPVPAPRDAAPARAIVPNGMAGFWLAGRSGLYRSDDASNSWSDAGNGLPEEPVTILLGGRSTPRTAYAIVGGELWASADVGRSWARRGNKGALANLDALAEDSQQPALLWAAGAGRVFRSDDAGSSWRPAGPPLPEPNTIVHRIAASNGAIVITTDRGLYRRAEDGTDWIPIVDNLPAHLEAGPLVRDPIDPATLYAGFSLIPYPELWRRAVDHESAFSRVSAASFVGSAVLLVMIAAAALATLRWFGRYYSSDAPEGQSARDVGVPGKTLL
jgi:photosystem II stability/assembly factor-like uncharacterized protein